MKKKTFGLFCVTVVALGVLLGVLIMTMAPAQIAKPTDTLAATATPTNEPHTTKTCRVNWWEAGMLDVSVVYDDGTLSGGLLSVDEAREKYADDSVVLAEIEATAATERNVVWWQNETEVLVGIGDTDEVLPMDEAVAKYAGNSVISAKLSRLQVIPTEVEIAPGRP